MVRAALVLTLVTACSTETTCEPQQCHSCEIGYYGPRDVPPGAQHVLIESDAASVRVWFNGGPTYADATTPARIALPAGTTRITAVTGAALRVSFDDDACARVP